MPLRLVLAPALLFLTCHAAAEADKWTPAEMIAGSTVGAAAVSPDGGRVAWVVSSPVMTDEESTYRGAVYVGTANPDDTQRFTFGEQNAANPQWSPDGNWLAYTSTPAGGKSNLYVIAANGGGARKLTEVTTGVSAFKWAPGSRRIAYLATDEADEAETARNKAKDDAITVDGNYKYQHLWLVEPPTDPADDVSPPERLTEGEFQVSPGYAGGFDWSPDGLTIAFAHSPTPELNDWPRTDISTVEVSTGAVTPLQDSPAAEYSPTYAADGKRLAFVRTNNPPSWMRDVHVAVLDLGSGEISQLADTPDDGPLLAGWLNAGTLLITETTGTRTTLFKLPVNGNSPDEFAEAAIISAASLSPSGRHLALVKGDATTPGEVYLSRTNRYSPTRVSNVHKNQPTHPFGKTELITWQSTDEMQIEGLLTYPVGYSAGTRVPLLLMIHGGPAGTHRDGYLASPRNLYPTAAFAANGYAILRANPRGSGGYGADFRRANRNDWGGMDFQDLMSGVDKVIQMGVADPERLGVMGWSYGGFMTSWVITHTNRFKAASIGAPVTDLIAFNGTADITGFLPDYFQGEFWEQMDSYLEHSPLMHVASASTPALIQHGQADARVPLGQGSALYRALKRQGVETKMVIYPRAPHGPREPRQRLDIMKDNLAWFAEYLPAD